MKEKLRVPIYIRYMDDILMMDNDRQRLKEYVAFLERYSFENLKLTLKPPLYFKSFGGVPFLGYRVKPYCLMLTNKSKRRFQKKFFALHKALKEDEIDEVIYNIKKSYPQPFRLKDGNTHIYNICKRVSKEQLRFSY